MHIVKKPKEMCTKTNICKITYYTLTWVSIFILLQQIYIIYLLLDFMSLYFMSVVKQKIKENKIKQTKIKLVKYHTTQQIQIDLQIAQSFSSDYS